MPCALCGVVRNRVGGLATGSLPREGTLMETGRDRPGTEKSFSGFTRSAAPSLDEMMEKCEATYDLSDDDDDERKIRK